MAAIRWRDTKPELVVRRILHRLGYRYRVNMRQFSARPDLVFTARRRAIFIHGCFWHGHTGCRDGHVPRTRTEFWIHKLAATKARDERFVKELQLNKWEVLVLWECEISDPETLADRLVGFLGPARFTRTKS